jgi:hypothetical protein
MCEHGFREYCIRRLQFWKLFQRFVSLLWAIQRRAQYRDYVTSKMYSSHAGVFIFCLARGGSEVQPITVSLAECESYLRLARSPQIINSWSDKYKVYPQHFTQHIPESRTQDYRLLYKTLRGKNEYIKLGNFYYSSVPDDLSSRR